MLGLLSVTASVWQAFLTLLKKKLLPTNQSACNQLLGIFFSVMMFGHAPRSKPQSEDTVG